MKITDLQDGEDLSEMELDELFDDNTLEQRFKILSTALDLMGKDNRRSRRDCIAIAMGLVPSRDNEYFTYFSDSTKADELRRGW